MVSLDRHERIFIAFHPEGLLPSPNVDKKRPLTPIPTIDYLLWCLLWCLLAA